MEIDFSSMRPKRKPNSKARHRYKKWVKYLKDSRLSDGEIYRRAAQFSRTREPPV